MSAPTGKSSLFEIHSTYAVTKPQILVSKWCCIASTFTTRSIHDCEKQKLHISGGIYSTYNAVVIVHNMLNKTRAGAGYAHLDFMPALLFRFFGGGGLLFTTEKVSTEV